jgi:hypothetical protein
MASGKTYFTASKWSQAKAAAELADRASAAKAWFDNAANSNSLLIRVGTIVSNFYVDLAPIVADPEVMTQMARTLVLQDADTRKTAYANITHVVTSTCSQANLLWAMAIAQALGDGAVVSQLNDTPCGTSGNTLSTGTNFPEDTSDDPQFLLAFAQLNQVQTVIQALNTLEALYGAANINSTPDTVAMLNLCGYQNTASLTGQMASVIYSVKQLSPLAYDFASLPQSFQSIPQVGVDEYFKSGQYTVDKTVLSSTAALLCLIFVGIKILHL